MSSVRGPDPHEPLERRRLLAGRARRSRRGARAAATSTPACGSRRTGPAAAGTARRGQRVGPMHARRRRDGRVRPRRGRRARRAARRGRSPGPAASPTRSPNPKSMITGRAPATRMFAARSERCASRAPCSRLRPRARRASSRAVVDLVGRQLVEPAAVDVLERRAPSSRRRGAVSELARRAAHAGPLRQQQEQRLVFDVLLERHRRPVVVRAAQQRGAVAAVEEVGVAAVACVDLDERPARRRRGAAV